ncbi:hypothetical protein MRB53_036253 [Persea americana]|nr:hypothetical protein MRB53_036710 [Persea americana]KAJ8614363.1 hypothetical protein MRB53_036644 [Persea americana]KAJ8614765.1 hypothetical protein MRB53_036431 [Persea americana]KAJ8614840.1 hypothetical protein MRB53_036253 [Persea americana]
MFGCKSVATPLVANEKWMKEDGEKKSGGLWVDVKYALYASYCHGSPLVLMTRRRLFAPYGFSPFSFPDNNEEPGDPTDAWSWPTPVRFVDRFVTLLKRYGASLRTRGGRARAQPGDSDSDLMSEIPSSENLLDPETLTALLSIKAGPPGMTCAVAPHPRLHDSPLLRTKVSILRHWVSTGLGGRGWGFLSARPDPRITITPGSSVGPSFTTKVKVKVKAEEQEAPSPRSRPDEPFRKADWLLSMASYFSLPARVFRSQPSPLDL